MGKNRTKNHSEEKGKKIEPRRKGTIREGGVTRKGRDNGGWEGGTLKLSLLVRRRCFLPFILGSK